jgi:hypothetical protein
MSSSPGSVHGSASAGWAVVTASGIVQSRCGRRIDGKPPAACSAWRLSRPGMRGWRPCYACGSDQVPRTGPGIIALDATYLSCGPLIASRVSASADMHLRLTSGHSGFGPAACRGRSAAMAVWSRRGPRRRSRRVSSMRWLEVRRHSHTKKGTAGGRGSHLSAQGVALARLVGGSLGPFAYVVTSASPRAVETAVAMGFAVDDMVELPSGYVPGEVEHHDQCAGRGPTSATPSCSDARAGSPWSPRSTGASGHMWCRPCRWRRRARAVPRRRHRAGAGGLPAGCRPWAVGAPFGHCDGARSASTTAGSLAFSSTGRRRRAELAQHAPYPHEPSR